MICPFCSFERTDKDVNPEWECPSCKKAYNKFEHQGNIKYYPDNSDEAEDRKTNYKELIIAFFAIAICIYPFIYLAVYGEVELCAKGGCHSFTLYDSPFMFIFTISAHLFIGYAILAEHTRYVNWS